MPDKVRAKLTVESVTRYDTSETVNLIARYSGAPEDNTYAQATPSAALHLNITNPDLLAAFQPGQVYYVDLTPAS